MSSPARQTAAVLNEKRPRDGEVFSVHSFVTAIVADASSIETSARVKP